jgi:hypothetical protein
VLTGKELAQLVYDRDIGEDSCAHSVMGLISRNGKNGYAILLRTGKMTVSFSSNLYDLLCLLT